MLYDIFVHLAQGSEDHMTRPTKPTPRCSGIPEAGQPAEDTADWRDWEHWQGVEEYRDIVDGLGASPLDDFAEGDDTAGETTRRHLLRHLHRRGIELER
jgi:hypothetical protein